jgi:hypothetical protein
MNLSGGWSPNDEEAPDDPRTVVYDEIEIIDVHGPYLTFEHLLSADIDGGPPHQHRGRRYVVDVRSGHLASLTELLGADDATTVVSQARASLAQLTDSIRQASRSGDDRASVAIETLDTFLFDSTSFGITDLSRDPAIAFMVPGHSADGEALALYLPPIAVKAPAWWTAVRATLPEWSKDSSRVRWDRSSYEVVATPSEDGDALALVLRARGLATSRAEWPVATVAAPAYQLIALEKPPLDSAGRAALARAFDAFVHGDDVTTLDHLLPLMPTHERLGGSRAQRDLLEYLVIVAQQRAGRPPGWVRSRDRPLPVALSAGPARA